MSFDDDESSQRESEQEARSTQVGPARLTLAECPPPPVRRTNSLLIVVIIVAILLSAFFAWKRFGGKGFLTARARTVEKAEKTPPNPAPPPPAEPQPAPVVKETTAAKPAADTLAEKKELKGLKLQGIIYQPGRSSAFINGKSVSVGKRIGDFLVARIDRDSVMLVDDAGQTNLLETP